MSGPLERFKPAVRARVHLLLAALLWTVVGALLLIFGARWTWLGAGGHAIWLVALALTLGALKARFVLGRTARRTVARIRERGDGRCIGGFLSWRSWLFVLLMMTLGRVLRGGLLPLGVVGFIYATVGAALVLAAWPIWRAWRTS